MAPRNLDAESEGGGQRRLCGESGGSSGEVGVSTFSTSTAGCHHQQRRRGDHDHGVSSPPAEAILGEVELV